MKEIKETYTKHFTDRDFLVSFFSAFAILICALFINFYAGLYATKSASNAVTDIVLSNIRVYNVDKIFIYGPWIFWIFVTLFVISKPYKIPFIVKSIALFVVIRSIFISLTHIGPFPTQLVIDSTRLISDFTSGGDLFFSAHTGLPFLMALIFWNHKYLRVFFVATSIMFGIVVLMGHLHYSIDVFAAFFITYSIFHISEVLFKKDFKMFKSDYSEFPSVS
jgi:hypothetical protein